MKLLILLSIFSTNIYAWGPIGHRVVGKIAEDYLTDNAEENVKKLLGTESLAMSANWADFIKSDPNWSHAFSWHYVSIPDGKTYAQSKKNKDGDIIAAIKKFTKTLKSKRASVKDKTEALKFLVHLIGDIHQPLHVGRAGDKGGNDITIRWFGEKSNLHRVWDEGLIGMQKLSYTEYTDAINHPTKKELTSWSKDSVEVWAKESMSFRKLVYDIVDNPAHYAFYPEYKYNFKVIKVLNKRLLQAGVRLAAVLNEVYK